VLTTPEKSRCRTSTPLKFINSRMQERLQADLTLADPTAARDEPVVLALTAGTSSGGGDYKATGLSASSTWEAGGSSGSFSWKYSLRTPSPAAGPSPELALAYDSGSVDGRTASSNNQGSWVGEGFDVTGVSYIERKYGSCDDDGQADKFDMCWKYDNATVVLNGKATELVKDDTTAEWRLADDDASSVTHSTGGDNGDDNGEYWTIVTGDGNRYVFGMNALPGAGAGVRTNSVWTVPVFGDDSGEPGYSSGSTFAGRDKVQAWRWNLDYVVDTHGNAMTYWYTSETNHYAKNGVDNPGTTYTRGGYLKEIRYGQREGALFTGTPAASHKVVFSVAERCLAAGSGCDSLGESTRDNWPDVPFDLICNSGDTCTGQTSPSFFTRKRLTGVTTYVWDAAAATPDFTPVDAWSFTHQYLDPGDTGDSSDQSLWLDKIVHTGKRGTDISLDPVNLGHQFLTNRVDATDDILPLNKPRLRTVTSEAGAQTIVDYMPQDCVRGSNMPSSPDANTMRCYPVYWAPNGGPDPQLDWFQKYPVTGVRAADSLGISETVVHSYTYTGGGAWRYNEDPMTPADERTWSTWRGYGKVTHLVGNSEGTQSKTVTVFMRGMNGDRKADGSTKSVQVTGVKAPEIDDKNQYAGFVREKVTYDGAEEVGGTINDPWSTRTATQHKSYADIEAYYVRTSATHERTRITSGPTPRDRVRTTSTTFDSYGMPITVEDRGDDDITGDETCTRKWYARNAAVGITSLVSRTRLTAKVCSTADADLDLPADASRQGDVISDSATAFDGASTWSASQAPTQGEPTWTGRVQGYTTADAPIWQRVATTTFDALGRPTAVTDAHDRTVSTAYTPAAAGPVTQTVVTNPKGHTATNILDLASGLPVKTTDAANKITELEYDALGRTTKVWLPDRSKALAETPNYVFGYSVTANDPSWVSTGTLNPTGGGYNTSYELFDSLLRSRQTQLPSPPGRRVIGGTE
jgi:YD repeat-containing protein